MGRHWEGPAQHRALGEQGEMSPAPSRHHEEQTKALYFWFCSLFWWSAPSHGKRIVMAGGEFSVIPIAGSSIAGATSACEKVSCINSQCRKDLVLLTLYSLSCPWMVSRCTRVQVRATAVLFKTLILTSVGAALGSERSGIKQSGC